MRKEDTGGLFTAEDAAEAQARAERFEISATGPMFGADMRWPNHEALAQEEALLEGSGLPRARLRELRNVAPGTRRVARIRPEDVNIALESSDCLRLDLTLPKGAYATVVLRELQKPVADEPDESSAPDLE
jgi:tRNA pseudouridine13 synthase